MAVEQPSQSIEDQFNRVELPVSQGTLDALLDVVESVDGRPDADGWVGGNVTGIGGPYEINRQPEADRQANLSAFATIRALGPDAQYNIVQTPDGDVKIIDNATQEPLTEDQAAELLHGLEAPDLKESCVISAYPEHLNTNY